MDIDVNKNLQNLAEAYVIFLISKDAEALKNHLSLSFLTRQKATEHIKAIQKLQGHTFGIDPDVSLWKDYQITVDENGQNSISPFQFHIQFKSIINPLETEIRTLTIHKVVEENGKWKVAAIISDEEEHILNQHLDSHKEHESQLEKNLS